MTHGTLRSFSVPSSSESIRASCRPRRPTSPTPALSVNVIGAIPRRSAVWRDTTVFSEPVSTMKSCVAPRFTFARMMTFSFSSRKSIV